MMPMRKKKEPAYKNRTDKQEFDVELTLLKNRQLFLNDGITNESVTKQIKAMFALDTINHYPIMLYINSGGGSCTAGFALINAMKTVDSPIVTIINSEVCSMGGHISVAGNHRTCYEDSVFMAHDPATYMEDYFGKIKYRARFLERYFDIIEANLRRHTKLSDEELLLARHGELWLVADEMLEKGIVDEIIVHEDN